MPDIVQHPYDLGDIKKVQVDIMAQLAAEMTHHILCTQPHLDRVAVTVTDTISGFIGKIHGDIFKPDKDFVSDNTHFTLFDETMKALSAEC
jgi:hypothetical protein